MRTRIFKLCFKKNITLCIRILGSIIYQFVVRHFLNNNWWTEDMVCTTMRQSQIFGIFSGTSIRQNAYLNANCHIRNLPPCLKGWKLRQHAIFQKGNNCEMVWNLNDYLVWYACMYLYNNTYLVTYSTS